MPAVKNAPLKNSFSLEKPPPPEPNKIRMIQAAIHRNIKKERMEEIQRKKREEEERLKKEKASEEMDLGIVVEEMKVVIEPQMDPEEQLKALEEHLEELNLQKHKLFLLLKQILHEDEKRKQAEEAEKRKQHEQQRAAELAQYPNGRPEGLGLDSPRDGANSPMLTTPKNFSSQGHQVSQSSAQQLPHQGQQSSQSSQPPQSSQQSMSYMTSPRNGQDPPRKVHIPLSPNSAASPPHHIQRQGYYPPTMMPSYYPPPPVPRDPNSPVIPPYYPMAPYAMQQMQMQQMGILGHNPYNMRPGIMNRIPPTPPIEPRSLGPDNRMVVRPGVPWRH